MPVIGTWVGKVVQRSETSPSKHINPDTQKEQHGLLHEPGEVTLYGIEETLFPNEKMTESRPLTA